MKILTIANPKGGISKITTVTNLGAGLRQKGKKVLLIDLDTQEDLSYNMNSTEPTKQSSSSYKRLYFAKRSHTTHF